ncbi:MAG: glycosyltransferase [Usitatibacter sp.]
MPQTVDIVVPVYRGLAETRACLESVLAARSRRPLEIIAIDDASPEPAIRAWLRSLAADGRITLIAHEANRGFVASVNEGMAVHSGRDVVLLNSDTEVADGWLDRLAAHVDADAQIGTATPFSNNATICSYPRTLAANPLPDGESTATLDRAFAVANAGRHADIPTAVGFCMYIARRCLDKVGRFDEARYGTGYGEEVDFCMRAARAGYRHVIAGDVFVRHIGEVSFGGAGLARRAQAQATVDSLYPEFQEALRALLATDPILPLRRRADLERLRRSPRPRVLFVAHGMGGGIRRHIAELAEALEPGCEVLLLRPNANSYVTLSWLRRGEELVLWFHKDREWNAMVEVLRAICISRLHLHHVHGLPQAVLDLSRLLACPHDVTLHDYFAVCPQYHLTDGSGRYCGEPGETTCMKCEELHPAQWPLSIEAWRGAFAAFLGSAQRVIAPSRDCAERARRYFPDLRPRIAPHPQGRLPSPAAPYRILVPGALSPEKGLDLLEACAKDAHERGLPLHFRVLGYVARPLATWPEAPLTLTGEYPEGTLPRLIALERGDAMFFPAQCPETYSYTLTEAMASGLPIVATNLGSLPERLAGAAAAHLVPWDAPAARFNDELLAAAGSDHERTGTPQPKTPVLASMQDYRREYMEALASFTAPAAGPMPALQSGQLVDPREYVAQGTLVQLFDDGVSCGRAASRRLLREHAVIADAERPRLLAAAAASHAAEARALAADLRAQAVEHSTFWRLTAPLRALVHRLLGRHG